MGRERGEDGRVWEPGGVSPPLVADSEYPAVEEGENGEGHIGIQAVFVYSKHCLLTVTVWVGGAYDDDEAQEEETVARRLRCEVLTAERQTLIGRLAMIDRRVDEHKQQMDNIDAQRCAVQQHIDQLTHSYALYHSLSSLCLSVFLCVCRCVCFLLSAMVLA